MTVLELLIAVAVVSAMTFGGGYAVGYAIGINARGPHAEGAR